MLGITEKTFPMSFQTTAFEWDDESIEGWKPRNATARQEGQLRDYYIGDTLIGSAWQPDSSGLCLVFGLGLLAPPENVPHILVNAFGYLHMLIQHVQTLKGN